MSLLPWPRRPASAEPPPTGPTAAGAEDPSSSSGPGLDAATVDELLSAQAELIGRIKLSYGADRARFEHDLLVPIQRYASFVNRLPATADNYFAEPGGLFRLGLEVAFFSLQGTDGHIVAGRATISARRQIEPRWRLATFLAGLCSEVHRTLGQFVVTDRDGAKWLAYMEPLTDWLTRQRSARMQVRWVQAKPEVRSLGLFALPLIVPRSLMQHLSTDNAVVVPQLMSCLAGIGHDGEAPVMFDLVRRASALVIDRDLIATAGRHGRPVVGDHLARFLVDAMRRLVASHPAWTPNAERSRVWHGSDGLFVVWPNAATEIRKMLDDDQLTGIPKAPETILEVLLGTGVLERFAAGQPLWTIRPPGARDTMEAIKLSAPGVLLAAWSSHAQALSSAMAAASSPPCSGAQLVLPSQAAEPDVDLESPLAPTPVARTARQGDSHSEPLDLFDPPAASVPSEGPTCPVVRLRAPLRLDPRIRTALTAAVDSLNDPVQQGSAFFVADGVFVSHSHLRDGGLDIPRVLRSLGELAMVDAHRGRSPSTVQQQVGGETVAGLVIKAEFIEGWPPPERPDVKT